MRWDVFFEYCEEHNGREIFDAIDSLDSVEGKDDLICIADEINDKTTYSKLVQKAIGEGMRFDSNEICDLAEYVNEYALKDLLNHIDGPLDIDDLEYLTDYSADLKRLYDQVEPGKSLEEFDRACRNAGFYGAFLAGLATCWALDKIWHK